MKKLIIILTILISIIGWGQTNPIQDKKISPDGYFETVLDRFGNQYDIKDLQIGKDLTINQTISKSTAITCDSGIFELYFETGSGMENTADANHNARRDVICRVFKDISDFINTPLKNAGNTTKVKIWVRNINNISGVPSNALGLATTFYTMPYNTTANFGGIIDGEIYKTIQGGKDSYINTTAPLINSDGSSNSSGIYYHGMVAINFNNSTWNTNLLANAGAGQHDLYSVALHEVTHALGFNSLLKPDGTSVFGSGYKYYSRYDHFLKDNSGSQYLLTNTGACSTMYNYSFNSGLPISVLQPDISSCVTDQTTCTSAIKFFGTNTVPVYTPNCHEPGSSYSHFEDMCIGAPNTGNNTYFVMSNAQASATYKHFLKSEERNALLDIGYSLNTTFGNNTIVLNSFNNYGGSIVTGINVQGINDGISSTGAFSFIGNTGTTISISGILTNDYNATSFECVQDVFDTTSSISISGTTINFSSNISGLHLLRYIPINAAEKKGNITYVYIYVNELNNCGIPSACDFVINGSFEQHNGLPTDSSQLNGIVCGWNTVHTAQSSEYYHADSTLTFPNLKVPCNAVGYEIDNKNGKAYVGMYIRAYSDPFNESVRTKLKSPLLPNTTYQLSFEVSLSEGHSIDAQKCQAYLSKNLIIPSGYGYIPISNPNMLFTKATYSTITNGWDKIIFTFTTDSISGEEYLYVGGGLTSASGPSIFPLPAPIQIPGCEKTPNGAPYYYLDNVSLIPLNGANFNLPNQVCNTVVLPNLTSYLTAAPTNGIFTGNGIVNNSGIYSFNASTAGVGTHTITYTYTNSSGCIVTLTDSIEVINTNTITPTFNQIAPICSGATLQALPTTSTNGVTGIWSPALNNTATTTYTFNANTGQCASSTSTTMTITVLPSNDPSCNTNPCLPNLTLNTPETNSTITYKRLNWIETNSNYSTSVNQNVTMKAGDFIVMKTGTVIKSGSSYQAKIENCTATSRIASQDVKEIEVEKEKNNNISIFPNPTNSYFTISSPSSNIKSINIFSMEGKLIFTNKENTNTNHQEIDISNYKDGIYLLTVTTDDEKTMKCKLIKN